MATQRKEQLLKQLDVALNRKVQQKYYNNAKTQQIPNISQPQYAPDRYKKQSYVDSRQYTTREHKSPIQLKKSKQRQSDIRYQKTLDPEYSHVIPEKIKSSQMIAERGKEQILREEISTLQNQNSFLTNELNSFKKSIQDLQQESRLLKREEKQYFALKEQNDYLMRQNEQLKKKDKSRQAPTKDNSLISNLEFEQILKNMMMQLNLSFLTKQWTDSFVIEAVKNIGKQVNKLIQQKNKLTNKLKKFDIDTVLTKQNNQSYKQEINEMRNILSNYQAQLEACKNTINGMEDQFNLITSKNKQLQSRYKQANKQLECTKRQLEASKKQLKIIFDSSRHRKPKRQSSVVKRQKERQTYYDESTVFRSTSQTSSQTEIKEKIVQVNEKKDNSQQQIKHSQKEISSLQLIINELQNKLENVKEDLQEKVDSLDHLTTKMSELQEEKLETQTKSVELQEKIYHYEQYIKQLELKSQQINRDISQFMPKLKQMQEENNQLKQSHLHKDQELINKHRALSQLSNKNEQLQEKLDSLQLEFKKSKMELEKKSRQIDRLNEQLAMASGKNSQLQTSMLEKQNTLQHQLNSKISELREVINQKDQQNHMIQVQNQNQLNKLKKKLSLTQKQLDQQKTNSMKTTQQLTLFKETMQQKSLIFSSEKQKLKDAIQQIIILNRELTKKQTQYESTCHSLQTKVLSFQSHSSQVNQSYSQLEINLKKMQKQLEIIKNQNQRLSNKHEESNTQVLQLRLINDKLRNETQNYSKLQRFIEQSKTDLEQKNIQLLLKIGQNQKDKVSLKQKIIQLENEKKQLINRLTQMQIAIQDKSVQYAEGQQQLNTISQQNILLSQDLQKIRQDYELNDKSKIRQISNQKFDIQRLVRENKQLTAKIEQLNTLIKSKEFQEKEANQKLQAALEQNRSLVVRYDYLQQEVQMKDKNKEEDKYIFELKQKQYSLLIKKILSYSIQLGELQHCEDLQELLQVGSQKLMDKKKYEHEETVKAKDKSGKNEYQIHFNHEQPERKYHFGTQINSYEVLLSSRHRKQVQQNLNRPKLKQGPSTPRSFIFNLSPLTDRTEKRTEQKIIDRQESEQKKQ